MVSSLLAAIVLQSSLTVDRGDYVIHAEVMGSGRPMVALPGGPGFSGRSVWGIGFGMRESCRTYLFNQLGTGESQPKAAGADIAEMISLDKTIEDIEALRKASGNKKWIVFGQSWGVILALCYAARHPQSVDHLVLTSIPGLETDGTILSENLAKALPGAVERKLIDLELDPAISESEKAEIQVLSVLPYYFYEPSIGQSLLSRTPPGLFSSKVFLSLRQHVLNAAAYRDSLRGLRNYKGPVTMIQGHQDPCGASMPFLLKEKHLRQAEVTMLNRCGHFGWIESRQSFFAALYRALKLKVPEWADIAEYADAPAIVREAVAREEAGWPFGWKPSAISGPNM